MTTFSKLFEKKQQRTETKSLLIKETLKNKYGVFQEILAENNRILTILSEIEEKLNGGNFFDKEFVRDKATAAIDGVKRLIEHINRLSDNRYTQLNHIHAYLSAKIHTILADRTVIPASDLVLPIVGLGEDMSLIAGHKIANLSEISKRLNLPTPEGFVITSYAFKQFMEHNHLTEKITALLAPVDIHNFENLEEISLKIQSLVREADIPSTLELATAQAIDHLKSQVAITKGHTPSTDFPLFVSVRSSALHEDSEFTFAGQYATFLNVRDTEISANYKEVIASLFTPKALFYAKNKNFNESDLVMAVGVMRMLHANAGGVMYTRDPNNPNNDTTIINAVWGLGKGVVDGETPASFLIPRDTNEAIGYKIPNQEFMLSCRDDGNIEAIQVPVTKRGNACLTDEQIRQLVSYGLAIEELYGCPQDIEWAADENDRIFILQSRPLHTAISVAPRECLPRKLDSHPVLTEQGVIACKGIAHGKAFVLKGQEDLKKFPMGAVLVAHHTDTKFVTIMPMAAAIITDIGGVAGHMASLAREHNVPTILDTGNATKIITSGVDLTVDAFNGVVYSGRVEELLRPSPPPKAYAVSLFRDSRPFKTLQKVHSHITPLHMVDPDSLTFTQESCRTLHDITRFIHEKAMTEIIFMNGRSQEVKTFEDLMCTITFTAGTEEVSGLKGGTKNLQTDIPMTTHVLDLDREWQNNERKVSVKDVSSPTFHAFFKGLHSMKWPQPISAQPQKSFPLFPTSASIKGRECKPESKSYAIIANNYMNFNLKLGYHFSMVEAYASKNINDNYIKYFFKGGGASLDRKLRRVRLIRELLEKMHFHVTVIDDVVNAMLKKYRHEDIERRLEIMGKLTVYTKQLDMAMFNDAITDMFIEDFTRDHIPEE